MHRTTIALMISAFMAGPAAGQSTEEISKRLDAIEKRLNALEAIPSLGGLLMDQMRKNTQNESQANSKGDMAKEVPEQPKFTARLIDIKPAGKDLLGEQGYKITIEVTNESGKDAELINAYIRFEDKLGNSLGQVMWEKSKGIAAGKSTRMTGSYRDRRDQLDRLAEIDRSLVTITFDIYKIAFKGGEVVTLKECTFCNF